MPSGSLKINTTYTPRPSSSLDAKTLEADATTEATSETPAATVTAEVEYSLYDSDLSDLTPLSSPIEAALPFKDVRDTNGKDKDGRNSAAQSSLTSKPDSAKSNRQAKAPLLLSEETKVGTHVWVLVDREARVLEPKDTEKGVRKKDWVWWPAKVKEQTARSVKVQLYGSPAPGKHAVEIRTPSDANILSLCDSKFRRRYTVPTFVDPVPRSLDASKSPRKRQKVDRTEIEKRWHLGVDELSKDQRTLALEDSDVSDDEMPAVGSLGFDMLTASLSSIAENGTAQDDSNRGKRKRPTSLTSSSDTGESSWTPPLPDDMLQIPGEGVLAADHESKAMYWPARIWEYVPPQKPSQQPKYLVEYLDTSRKEIPRDWFFTSEQAEFVTCKLGKWESLLQEVENDEEADKLDRSTRRSPSPEPLEPPPEPKTYLVDLSMHEQLSYIKPVLQAILNASFNPALGRHNKYLAGGSSRKAVVDEASSRGTMDPKDVTKLQEHLREWCLRERSKEQVQTGICDANEDGGQDVKEREGTTITPAQSTETGVGSRPPSPTPSDSALSIADLPPSSSFPPSECDNTSPPEKEVDQDPLVIPPRQKGCEAYEALSTVEKLDYCLNVLLPEAILQILLWRRGHRRSVQLLSDEEEEALHEKGLELIRERDWVRDVMRFRELKEGGKKNGKVGEVYSVTGRLKRNVAVPSSYRELD